MGCGSSTSSNETIEAAKVPAPVPTDGGSTGSSVHKETKTVRRGIMPKTLPGFVNAFLDFDREERRQTCEKAFLEPQDTADKTELKKIVDGINTVAPTDVAGQTELLTGLYTLWNKCLLQLETEKWQNQGPTEPIKFNNDTVVAVVGGKYVPAHQFRGTGDWIVSEVLEQCGVKKVHSFARSPASELPSDVTTAYTHHTALEAMIQRIAEEKKPGTKVIFVFTVAKTADNGEASVNVSLVDTFIAACDSNGLLSDTDMRVLHMSTFHASPKDTGHEDNLVENYGLTDYGASKVMQTCQLADEIYSRDPATKDHPALARIKELRKELDVELKAAWAHWNANPADAKSRSIPEGFEEQHAKLVASMVIAARELFEDSAGEDSLIFQLRKVSSRLGVVKVPYMLSNTAVYKRFFVFNPAIRGEKDAFTFYKICSMKRLRIVMTPRRAAMWHVEALRDLH